MIRGGEGFIENSCYAPVRRQGKPAHRERACLRSLPGVRGSAIDGGPASAKRCPRILTASAISVAPLAAMRSRPSMRALTANSLSDRIRLEVPASGTWARGSGPRARSCIPDRRSTSRPSSSRAASRVGDGHGPRSGNHCLQRGDRLDVRHHQRAKPVWCTHLSGPPQPRCSSPSTVSPMSRAILRSKVGAMSRPE